jgi:hypothetical protein
VNFVESLTSLALMADFTKAEPGSTLSSLRS